MKPNLERIKEIFSVALLKQSPAKRESYLAEACQGEPEVRQQVESLLRAQDQAGDFLGQNGKMPVASFVTERAGTKIGRYKLLELIGEGGFGTVWMAEQEESVRRRVALKVIKPGMDTKQVLARFEAERQALAMMDHPSIARVFDGGATDTGRPYFVMELVRGTRITDYCDVNKLSTSERLALFIQVCQAVQHAHQKGIIHRDLKPSNILVTEVDGAPVPKVIDFGVAKATQARLTERTLFTGLHQMIGTPSYMSPEQAGLGALDMDTRSDIYALGVLLYELLTGQTPLTKEEFEKAGLDEIFRLIREQDPPKPSTRLSALTREELTAIAAKRQAEPFKLNRLLTGDLDWIVMKALEKDRRRRYETVSGLVTDLQRHVNNEPVLARPPSNLYRFQKMVRRNKLVFVAGTAVAVAVLAGLTASTYLFIQEKRAHERATRAETLAEQRLAESEAFSKSLTQMSEHSFTVGKMNNQPVFVYDAAGRQAAIELQEKMMAFNRTARGAGHPDTLNAMETLADSYEEAGRKDEALKLRAEALTLRSKLAEAGPTSNRLPAETNDTSASTAQILTYRAFSRAQTGRFQEAAADSERAIEIDPSDHVPWYLLTPLLVQTGRIADYQAHCKRMLERFEKTTIPEVAERTAKTCLLLPSAVGPDDLTRADKVADNALSYGKDSPWIDWFQFTKGLAEYRQGHFSAAIERMKLAQMEVAHARDSSRDMCEADTYLVRAMAHHQLKQPEDAQSDLSRGLAIVREKLPKLDSGDLDGAWLDTLMTYSFMRQAQDTVNGAPAGQQR